MSLITPAQAKYKQITLSIRRMEYFYLTKGIGKGPYDFHRLYQKLLVNNTCKLIELIPCSDVDLFLRIINQIMQVLRVYKSVLPGPFETQLHNLEDWRIQAELEDSFENCEGEAGPSIATKLWESIFGHPATNDAIKNGLSSKKNVELLKLILELALKCKLVGKEMIISHHLRSKNFQRLFEEIEESKDPELNKYLIEILPWVSCSSPVSPGFDLSV